MPGLLDKLFGTTPKKQKPRRQPPKGTSFGEGPNKMRRALENRNKKRRNVMDEIRKTRGG